MFTAALGSSYSSAGTSFRMTPVKLPSLTNLFRRTPKQKMTLDQKINLRGANEAALDPVNAPGGSRLVTRANAAKGPGLNRFNQAAKNLLKTGQQNTRTLRGWAKSKGFVKKPNPGGGPEVWGVKKPGGGFEWRLKIKPEASPRVPGSNMPRFDARVGAGEYINPFTGQTGGKAVGTHIPLE
jgi:hypothetical protein